MITHAIITGSSGFIGGALVEHLEATGTVVLGVDQRPPPVPGDHFLEADLTIPGVLDPVLNADSVLFHMAAHAQVADSVENPVYDHENNVRALLNVLESARAARARVLFPSSAAVFDPGEPLPLKESALKKPSSPYGAAKLAGEAYCVAYHRCYNLDVKIARMFNVYGPGMRRFAIFDFYRNLKKNPARLEILGDGNQLRDYLYIDDALRGLACIATRGAPGEDYNLASGQPISSRDLARNVAEIMGYPAAEVVPRGKTFAGDVSQWYADITKLSSIGFSPGQTLEEGLRQTIAGLDQAKLTD